jgi:hypothetical protein
MAHGGASHAQRRPPRFATGRSFGRRGTGSPRLVEQWTEISLHCGAKAGHQVFPTESRALDWLLVQNACRSVGNCFYDGNAGREASRRKRGWKACVLHVQRRVLSGNCPEDEMGEAQVVLVLPLSMCCFGRLPRPRLRDGKSRHLFGEVTSRPCLNNGGAMSCRILGRAILLQQSWL